MLRIQVNGKSVDLSGIDPDTPLLWVLRDHLALTGTRFGCGKMQCGSCTVRVDGQSTRTCQLPIKDVDGKKITTIEGLSDKGDHVLQQAWREHDVPQCGYCQSGQIMSAVSLLEQKPEPTDDDIDAAMSGNICRCGSYPRIRAAIHTAAKKLRQPAAERKEERK
jgi:aerobic-type carbon monoxide dehydrogenase small subunit (CoxS/CutS family)